MKTSPLYALGIVSVLAGAAPAFAQGATESPPAPNSANSEPESPNSLPPGARTLPPGSTGTQQMGSLTTTRVQPAPRAATSAGSAAQR